MRVTVPSDEAVRFTAFMRTDECRKAESDYKRAVQMVMSALLSPEMKQRDDFPMRLADVFRQAMPDLDALGLTPEQQAFIRTASQTATGGLRNSLANLAGGRWGAVQFDWIPRAIDMGLSSSVADAFRQLVAPEEPLGQRVDTFRDQLYAVCDELDQKGGFEPNWRSFRVSLSFVALILGGLDPSQYTFYNYGALSFGYKQYAPDAIWPKGTMGEIYVSVCEFVRDIKAELVRQSVPVQDLIDAQTFVWVAFTDSKAPAGLPPKKNGSSQPKPDADIVAADLAEAVCWETEDARRLVQLSQRWDQLLFQGPPGTGKTFVAKKLAELLCEQDERRLEFVQFHPSYAYEDFMEGIRPVPKEGWLSYEVRKGVFLRLARAAQEDPDNTYYLVVDELNRANLPRVFGELLYALEYRGRESPFNLPYSGDKPYIPKNLKMIATMNTADRSIAFVDAAVRRRFRHWRFQPEPLSNLVEIASSKGLELSGDLLLG